MRKVLIPFILLLCFAIPGFAQTSVPLSGSCTVTYNSDGSANLVCSASTVVPAAPAPSGVVSVAISPTAPTVQTSGTVAFTATVTVTGTVNQAVTWSATAGTISSSGLFTAPATTGSVVVTATSVADTTKSASATVTVVAPVTASSFQQLATDIFNRANGPLGANWGPFLASSSVPPQIVNQQVQSGNTSYSDSMYYGGINWPADQYSQAQIIAVGANGARCGPTVRASSIAEYIGLVMSFGNGNAGVEIVSLVGGTFTQLIVTTNATVLQNDYVQLSVQGTTLTLTNVTRSMTLLTVNDSTISAGYPGMHFNPAGGLSSNTTMANWSGGATSVSLALNTLASDNFVRANASNLGPNWTVGGAGLYPITVVSNQMQNTSSQTSLESYTAVAFPSDQWAQGQITTAGGNALGPMVRYQTATNNFYFLDVNQTGPAGTALVRIMHFAGGSPTSIPVADNTYATVALNDYVRLQVQGPLVSAINVTTGALLLSYDDTSASALSGGSPGWFFWEPPSTPSSATNWSGGKFGP